MNRNLTLHPKRYIKRDGTLQDVLKAATPFSVLEGPGNGKFGKESSEEIKLNRQINNN